MKSYKSNKYFSDITPKKLIIDYLSPVKSITSILVLDIANNIISTRFPGTKMDTNWPEN